MKEQNDKKKQTNKIPCAHFVFYNTSPMCLYFLLLALFLLKFLAKKDFKIIKNVWDCMESVKRKESGEEREQSVFLRRTHPVSTGGGRQRVLVT